MAIVTLGIDLGKNLNSVVGLNETGQIVLRRRVRRGTLPILRANFRLVPLPWRLAAGRIMSVACLLLTGMRCG